MAGKPKTEEPVGMTYDRVLNEALIRIYQLAEVGAILPKENGLTEFQKTVSLNSVHEEMKYLREKIGKLCRAE